MTDVVMYEDNAGELFLADSDGWWNITYAALRDGTALADMLAVYYGDTTAWTVEDGKWQAVKGDPKGGYTLLGSDCDEIPATGKVVALIKGPGREGLTIRVFPEAMGSAAREAFGLPPR